MSEVSKPHSVQDDILTVRAVLDVYLAQQQLQSPQTGIVITTGAYINGAMESLAALRRLEEQYEDAERDRDRLQHFVECADTPLMRDVLAERDGLKEQLEAAISLEGWEDMRQFNIRLEERARELQGQLEATQNALREIAALPCYLDVVDQDEPDPRMTSLGDGDCPSCFAGLALPVSSPASEPYAVTLTTTHSDVERDVAARKAREAQNQDTNP